HQDEYVDPLYVATRDQFNGRGGLLIGTLGNPKGDLTAEPPGVSLQMSAGKGKLHPSNATDCALAIGLMVIDGAVPPPVRMAPGYVPPATGTPTAGRAATGTSPAPAFAIIVAADNPAWAGFGQAFFKAVGEAQSYKAWSQNVLGILGQIGSNQ